MSLRFCNSSDSKMPTKNNVNFFLSFFSQISVFGDTECVLTAKKCTNFPHFSGTQFRDDLGETHLNVGRAAGPCLRRAEDFHHWCGNGRNSGNSSSKNDAEAFVAATHIKSQTTQIYYPDACDAEWSLFGRHCYLHVWKKKDWYIV